MTAGVIRTGILGLSLVFGSVFGSPQTTIPAVAAQQMQTLPAAQNSDDSMNWAGYVADSGSNYTSISGTWVVPTISDPSGNGADATWVGIGGVKTRDLIQAGTEAIPDTSGNLTYQAWYELLPGDSTPVPLSVSPGDSVTVSITQGASGEWTISFRDDTTGSTYEKTVSYDSSLSSAEWIEEMPVAIGEPISLDDFGVVGFTGGTTIDQGQAQTIQEAGATPLTMTNSADQVVAMPSTIGADGASFSVTRTEASASPLQLGGYGRARPTVAASNASRQSVPQQISYSGHFGRHGSWRVVVVQF